MRVMVIGGGAREHALVWKLQFSPQVSAVYAAPGNAGISFLARTEPVGVEDVRGLLRMAVTNAIELTVVGPEVPLAAGIVDAFQEAGLRIFGPTRAAAQIESSKIFAKELMQRHEIPTARWVRAEHGDEARQAVRDFGAPVVLKADGLAGGKGVVICHSIEQADQVIDEYLSGQAHGEAGQRLVIEERLEGPELSVFALVDGQHVVPLLAARDYKPLLDDDQGPNTGGMGGYTRPAYATDELLEEVLDTIIKPTVRALAAEGAPYVGVLYTQLMLTSDGPRVIEFNSRWGDPEGELILPLLKSDLVELMLSCIEGRLDQVSVEWNPGVSCGVVLAAEGYPENPMRGAKIAGLDELEEGVLAFHGGTRLLHTPEPRRSILRRGIPRTTEQDIGIVVDGGRVLTVVATGPTLAEAREKVYASVDRISFDGMQFRRDIGAFDPSPALVRAGLATQTRLPTSSHSAIGESAVQPGATPPFEPTPGEPPVDENVTRADYVIPAAPAPNPETSQPPPPFVAPTEPAAPDPMGRPAPSAPSAAPSPARAAPASGATALVAVLMGSESDKPIMEETTRILETLGIPHEMHVMSAHRTPERVRQFARSAESRGVKVIIAGAGGAAHLPGVIAAQCTLPVIGVPILGSALAGLDSLLSIVQMPGGVPVATVAVGSAGARNAAYLAASMIGLTDENVRARYRQFRIQQSGGELA